MSDFFNSGWSVYIAVFALAGIVFCLWLLFTQRKWLHKDVEVEDTGHVWDGNITELNTSVPRWWTIMYLSFYAFRLIYLILYPGLGSFKGTLGYTTAAKLKDDQEAMQERIEPLYGKYRDMDSPAVAADAVGRLNGIRLFVIHCVQCHACAAQ